MRPCNCTLHLEIILAISNVILYLCSRGYPCGVFFVSNIIFRCQSCPKRVFWLCKGSTKLTCVFCVVFACASNLLWNFFNVFHPLLFKPTNFQILDVAATNTNGMHANLAQTSNQLNAPNIRMSGKLKPGCGSSARLKYACYKF